MISNSHWWIQRQLKAHCNKADKYYSKGKKAPGKYSRYEIARLVYYHDCEIDWLGNKTGRDELKRLGYSDNEIDWCYKLMYSYFNGFPNDPNDDHRGGGWHVDWREPDCWVIPVELMKYDMWKREQEDDEEPYLLFFLKEKNQYVGTHETWCLPDYLNV